MSRFLRAPLRTRTITGTASVGGTSSTKIDILPNSAVRFVDRFGQTVDAPLDAMLAGNATVTDRNANPLARLVDVLLARGGV